MRSGNKVGIVGIGSVGSSLAFSLIKNRLVRELILIDRRQIKAKGETLDLLDASSLLHPTQIFYSDYDGLKGADIVAITCGAAQKKGETRLDLINTNIQIFKEVLPKVLRYINEKTILIIITNPVDILTYATLKVTGLDKRKVIGSGTVLDSSRLKHYISQYSQIDPRNIHAYVVGEHGDNEFVLWDHSYIGGMKLEDYLHSCNFCECEQQLDKMEQRVRNSVYEIINAKGTTNWGIAECVTKIISSILRSENSILPISTYIENYYDINDVCLSLPSIINRKGIEKTLHLKLSDSNLEKLKNIYLNMKEVLKKIKI